MGAVNGGFNPGVAILNSAFEQRLTWEIGVWGNDSNPFGYSIGNDWAFTGRTTYLLFYDEPSKGRYLWEIGDQEMRGHPTKGWFACGSGRHPQWTARRVESNLCRYGVDADRSAERHGC